MADCNEGLAGLQWLVTSRSLRAEGLECARSHLLVLQCSGMQLLWDQLAALYMVPLLSVTVLKLLQIPGLHAKLNVFGCDGLSFPNELHDGLFA